MFIDKLKKNSYVCSEYEVFNLCFRCILTPVDELKRFYLVEWFGFVSEVHALYLAIVGLISPYF